MAIDPTIRTVPFASERKVTTMFTRRLVVNPHGVSHNPCTLIARTIAAFDANGFTDAADQMRAEFTDGNAIVYVENKGEDISEQDWFTWLEDKYPVLYRDVVAAPFGKWENIWLDGPTELVELTFSSTVNPRSQVIVMVHSHDVFPFVSDLERSGLYLLVKWAWMELEHDGSLVRMGEQEGNV